MWTIPFNLSSCPVPSVWEINLTNQIMMLSQDWTWQCGPLADGVEPPYNREEERENRKRVNYTVALQGCPNPRSVEESRRFNGFWEFLIGFPGTDKIWNKCIHYILIYLWVSPLKLWSAVCLCSDVLNIYVTSLISLFLFQVKGSSVLTTLFPLNVHACLKKNP